MSLESHHFYSRDGKACHTQPCKSKTAKNPTRPTTIADARKLGLLPSVSGITGMMANPALDRYKQMRVAEEAYDRPAVGEETKDEYVSYLLDKAQEQTRDAADLGTEIHAILEDWGKGAVVDTSRILTFPSCGLNVPVGDIVDSVARRIGELGIEPAGHECVVVNAKHGYAGTTDMPFTKGLTVGILDFKSAKTTPGEPIGPRTTYAMQIAAYIAAYWGGESHEPIKDNALGYNLYISTTEPGRVELATYTAEQLRQEWEAFQACLTLWRHKNKYDPRSK